MNYSMIKENPLFHDINDFDKLIKEILVAVKSYKKNEMIFSIGDPCGYIGLLLEGAAHVQQIDFFGNQSIVTPLHQGDMFAEAFACSNTETMPVQVCAVTNCKVFFTTYKTLENCEKSNLLMRNLFRIMANKNVQMAQKMNILSKRTIREKILAYVALQAARATATTFEIPFNRQQLADYLCVDRSSLSRELSHLKKDGILNIHRNKIQLYK